MCQAASVKEHPATFYLITKKKITFSMNTPERNASAAIASWSILFLTGTVPLIVNGLCDFRKASVNFVVQWKELLG